MRILAHRGWWLLPHEKNTHGAFRKALAAGYGIETDVRDCQGALVISHDLPAANDAPAQCMPLQAFLDLYIDCDSRPTLALNIKADGLAELLRDALFSRGITEYFVFDMSIPDTLSYLHKAMPVFTRRSEFETGSILDSRAQGLWLDSFEQPFVTVAEIQAGLAEGRPVAIVSPELHCKPHEKAWRLWRDLYQGLSSAQKSLFMLCTDFPKEAEAFFEH